MRNYTDEIQPSGGQSRQIDIYVDGCWLTRGKQNPVEKGGWGAVVTESRGGEEMLRWLPSDRLPEEANGSGAAEWLAALGGLKAVMENESRQPDRSPARIVLHTDQISMSNDIKRLIADPDKPANTPVQRWQRELAGLVEQSGATIEYTKAHKQNEKVPFRESKCMDVAHELASLEAYQARLEAQGHLSFGMDKLSYEGAQNFFASQRQKIWNLTKDLDFSERQR